MSYENIMRLWSDCSRLGVARPLFGVVTKTSSYTLTPSDFGKVFITRGATGAVTFTLPTASTPNKGSWALFWNVADQDMIVAGSEEDLVVFNDLTATNIGYKTSSEKIGGALLAVSDGTSWLVSPIATETQTVTLASSPSQTPSQTPSHTPSGT